MADLHVAIVATSCGHVYPAAGDRQVSRSREQIRDEDAPSRRRQRRDARGGVEHLAAGVAAARPGRRGGGPVPGPLQDAGPPGEESKIPPARPPAEAPPL